MQDRHQLHGSLRADVIEIIVGNQFARQIALALHAQDLVLQIYQPATVQPELPQPPRAEQQIQMLHAAEGSRARTMR